MALALLIGLDDVLDISSRGYPRAKFSMTKVMHDRVEYTSNLLPFCRPFAIKLIDIVRNQFADP